MLLKNCMVASQLPLKFTVGTAIVVTFGLRLAVSTSYNRLATITSLPGCIWPVVISIAACPSLSSLPIAILGLLLPTSSAISAPVMLNFAGSQETFKTGERLDNSVGSNTEAVNPGIAVSFWKYYQGIRAMFSIQRHDRVWSTLPQRQACPSFLHDLPYCRGRVHDVENLPARQTSVYSFSKYKACALRPADGFYRRCMRQCLHPSANAHWEW